MGINQCLEELTKAADRCQQVAKVFAEPAMKNILTTLGNAAESLGTAASGSWLGYQATIYTHGLKDRRPGEVYDSEWGESLGDFERDIVSRTRGDWAIWEYSAIEKEIFRRAGMGRRELARLESAARKAGETFSQVKDAILPIYDLLASDLDDVVLKEKRDEVKKLNKFVSKRDLASVYSPKSFQTKDTIAVQEGIRAPHHVVFKLHVIEQCTYGDKLDELAKIIRHTITYMKMKYGMEGKTMAKVDGRIFIGHGRSLLWMVLKDFLKDDLGLAYEEFNRESPAGVATTDRLGEMLENAAFAFLVMTAEDEHADATKHARENVIHEAGLFQGRLGFRKAIVMLEEGCAEFSNIHGLGQIRFPKANIMAAAEEVRKVLRRENIIS